MKKRELIKYIRERTPKTISVLGVPFEVRFNYRVSKAEKGTYAYTVGDDRIIVIYTRRITSLEQFKSTLTHELLHAALHVSGVTNALVEEQEEAVVVALEHFVTTSFNFKEFSFEQQ